MKLTNPTSKLAMIGFAIALVCPSLSGEDLPGFQQLVDDELFDFEFADLCDRVGLSRYEEVARSVQNGPVINRLVDGGQAGPLGLVPGDIILDVAGFLPWDINQDWKRDEPERLLRVKKANGEIQEVTLGPGKLGAYVYFPSHPARELTIKHDRETPGYEFLLGAIAVAHLNPKIAETALHKAIQLGYQPDEISSAAGIKVALRLNRPGDAWTFAKYIISSAGTVAEVPPGARISVLRAAFANGQVDTLHEAWKSWARGHLDVEEERLADLSQPDHDWKPSLRPSERISELSFREMSRQRIKVEGLRNTQTYPKTRNVTQRMEVRRGYYNWSYTELPHGMEDFVWELEFDCGPTALQGIQRWRPILRFQLRELGETRQDDAMMARLDLFKESSTIEIGSREIDFESSYATEWGFEAGMRPLKVRLIRLGNEVELQLDGATVLWMPCSTSRNVGLRIANSGMTVEFHKHRLWERIPEN